MVILCLTKAKGMVINMIENIKVKSKKLEAARYPELITDVFLCIMLLVFPLLFGPKGYVNLTEVKYIFFKWSTLVYLVVMVLLVAKLILVGKSREIIRRLHRPSITQTCILAYVLFCCISAAISKFGSYVWIGAGRYEGLSTILLYTALFLSVSYFGRFKKWHLYLIGIVILTNASLGFLQYAGLNPLMLFPKGYTFHDAFILYAGKFMGTLGNIDLLSAYLSLTIPLLYVYYVLHEKSNLLLIPFAVGLFILLLSGVSAGLVGIGLGISITIPIASNSKQSMKKTLIAGSLAALCVAVFKSLSVSYINRVTAISFKFGGLSLILVLIAGAMMILLNIINNLDKKYQWDEKKIRKILSIGIVTIAVAALAIVWAFPFANGTLASIHRFLHGEVDSKLGSSRIQIWQQVAKLVPEHLWFGGGPDTLAKRLAFSFQRYNAATGTNIQSFIDTAHNDYLNILANTGILSLLAYVSALISLAFKALKSGFDNPVSAVLFIGLLCYLIQIFFSFSICIVAPFFWVVLGLLEAALSKNKNLETKKLGKH